MGNEYFSVSLMAMTRGAYCRHILQSSGDLHDAGSMPSRDRGQRWQMQRAANTFLDFTAIRAAHERIRPHIHRTLVLTSERLNEASGASLFFKCENFQKIGAFKARGATHAVFSLD